MRWLRTVHLLHGIILLVMLLSGLFLYSSTTRTWFNQVGFPLVQFHVVVACIYIGLVCLSLVRVGRYLLKKPRIKRFNFGLNFLFFLLWLGSGLLMYFQAYMPAELRNGAVVVHDWTTFLFLPWLIAHTLGHLLKIELPWPAWWHHHTSLPPVIQENVLVRRDFLKLFSFGFLFFLIGSWVRWLTPILTVANEGNKRRGYFRIYNVTNDFPRYKQEDWKLTIDGMTNKVVTLSHADLLRLPSTSIVDDFHCVTGWSVRNVEMKGVLVKDLFELNDITTKEQFITAYSGDGAYFDSFFISQLIEEEALLVYEMEEEPLKPAQGFPCRLYHPNMYGYKSVKWIDRLEVTEKRKVGYWQQSGGYDTNGYL
jgi:hypothetical protein